MKKIKINQGDGSALTIVDLQKEFMCKNGALYVAGISGEASIAEIIKRTEYLVLLPFDHTATTEDKHPKGHVEFKIFGDHCVGGTRRQKYHDSLLWVYHSVHENLKKGMDKNIEAYALDTSPQFPDHIDTLKQKNTKKIFVAGLAYTHCVGLTAIAYKKALLNAEVYIVRDATRSVAPPFGDTPAMDEKLKKHGVKLINSSKIE